MLFTCTTFIACFNDPREEVPMCRVLYIIKPREKFDKDSHPCKFLPPKINVGAESYWQFINWEQEQTTELPLTMKMSEEKIWKGIEEPIILPKYPCHSQTEERMIPVITESCLQKVGYTSRHQWILSTMESRRLVPSFKTKKKDL